MISGWGTAMCLKINKSTLNTGILISSIFARIKLLILNNPLKSIFGKPDIYAEYNAKFSESGLAGLNNLIKNN